MHLHTASALLASRQPNIGSTSCVVWLPSSKLICGRDAVPVCCGGSANRRRSTETSTPCAIISRSAFLVYAALHSGAQFYAALRSCKQPLCSGCAAITQWANHVIGGPEHAKHIDVSKHFAHEAVQNGHMRLYKITTEFQLADILTKALQLHQFELCLHRLLEDAED
jgi:hypothetical protein